MADRAQFEASFSGAVRAAEELKAGFLRDAQIARQVGDETLAAQLKFSSELSKGPAAGGATSGTLTRENEILQQQVALKRLSVALDLETLDAIRAQNAQWLAQERLIGTKSGLLVPQEARYTGYEQTAGVQAARERQLAIERLIQEQLAKENAQLAEQAALEATIASRRAEASAAGFAAGQQGGALSAEKRASLMAAPAGLAGGWTAGTEAQIRYDAALGSYEGLATRADLQTQRLTANTLRLGVAEAEASNQLRRHGALTTEFLGALARGETTMSELGYQVGATIGKFAGWTAAAAATYGALGAVVEFGKGAIDASSGVQQLTRTIEGLDRTKAANALQGLSQATNVPMKEAADTTFLYSRTFHDLANAVTGAKDALSVFKLDQVSVNDSMQLSTLLSQQFGRSAQDQQVQWDMLAAGQREYNARISQTVPLLRNATGAVRASGGDLNQLIQLATLATRVYPGQGSNIGTAFARGAATYTPKNLADLQTRFGLGYGSEATNWTELLQHAIRESATMSQPDRRKLAADIFDPRFGSRLAGIFGPQAAATLGEITGTGPKAITPERTRGSLQSELDKELGTFRERMHSLVNEMQRVGAAIGSSGILNIFSELIHLSTGVSGAFRGVVDAFSTLPPAAREALEALVALRLAMLFVSRTRFGSSIPLVRNVPGFRPGEETLQRRSLATGNRQVIQALENDMVQTNAQLIQSGVKQQALEAQRLAILRAAGGAENLTIGELEHINELSVKIKTLGDEQVKLEASRASQSAAIAEAQERQVGLTAINRNRRYSPREVAALSADVDASAAAAATNRATIAGGQSIAAARVDEEAQLRLFGATEAKAAAMTADAAAGLKVAEALAADAVASDEAAVAMEADAVGAEESKSAMERFGASARGLVGALDPWLVAIVALPILYSEISSSIKRNSDATDEAAKALHSKIHNITDLRSAASRLQDAARKHQASQIHGSLIPGEDNTLNFWGGVFGEVASPETVAKEQGQGNQLKAIADLYKAAGDRFSSDANALAGTGAGQKKMYAESQQLKQRMGAVLQASGLPQGEINRIYEAFAIALQDDYNSAIALNAQRAKGKNFLDLLDRETTKDITKQVQAYADRADIYGVKGTDMTRLGETYLFLAARFRNSSDQTGLQLVKQAQQALVTAIEKNVTDLTDAAQGATTFGGTQADLGAAVGTIQGSKARVQKWVAQMDAKWKKYPSIVKAINDAAAIIDDQLSQKLQSVIQTQLQNIEAQANFQASQIQGISPESDIARAQVVLSGLQEALAKARSEGASWSVVNDLLTRINTSTQALIKQRIDNADAIAKAQEDIAVSSIGGTSPEADVARARQTLANAYSDLARDQANHAGQAKILEDQNAIITDQNNLNKLIQDNANAVAQATEELAIAKITGTSPKADIARARQAVANARADLARDELQGAGEAKILQDQVALYNDIRSLNDTIQQQDQKLHQDAASLIQSRADVAISKTTNPAAQAQDQLNADIKILRTIVRKDYNSLTEYLTARNSQLAKINKDRADVNQAHVDQQMSTLKFEYDTQQISDQAYVDGLRAILANKKLSLAERQQIQEEIFNVSQSGAVSLNTDSMAMPTTYMVKRAIQMGVQQATGVAAGAYGPSGPSGNTTNNNSITLYVSKDADIGKVSDVIDQAIKSNLSGAAQAMGLIG